MRTLALLAILLAATLAGCLEGDSGETDDTPDETPDAPMATPPEAIHYEGSLTGVGDTAAGTGGTGCTAEDASCIHYPLELDEKWKVTITLESINSPVTDVTQDVTSPTDYDLFLSTADGTALGESTNPGEDLDIVAKTLTPGNYDILVQAWNDQGGSYTLDIEFEAP